MHELSIALSLVDIVCEERARLNEGPVEAVHVRIGRLSAVVPHALRQSFDAAVEGSGIEGARLVIESVPVAIRCEICQADHELSGLSISCPTCGQPPRWILRGNELELVALEFADDAHR